MKALAIGFSAVVLILTGWVVGVKWGQQDLIAIGTFVVLALTLIVLVWYAYDTNSMARVTRERWEREGVLGTTYGIELLGEKGSVGRTLLRLNNPSSLVVWVKVNCNFNVYGSPAPYGELYDGGRRWVVFPQQMSQGWFELETLLQKKGKTVAAMINESTADNRKLQLTMGLEIEFWDELKGHRALPQREHYFDFGRWAWIPELGEPPPPKS